jgi:phosphoglucosamine mutase
MSNRLFGTDGIRGRVNEFPITAEVALRAGKAVAQVLRASSPDGNRVIVGKDTRLSGDMLEAALTAGLVAMGMDVYLADPMPTPAVALLTREMDAAAGIVLTASHNPFEDNGLKIFGPDGYKLNDELESLVERHILGEETEAPAVSPAGIGRIHRLDDAAERFAESAKQAAGFPSLDGLKVVIDCGNGAAWRIAPQLFRDLGAEVIATGVDPDGLNINAECGALYPQKAGELVREHGADLGVSFDGDADRVIFTDAEGQVISGDCILGLAAIALKEQGKLREQTLVCTVMSNLGLHEAMKRHGIAVEVTAVGDRHVLERIREKGCSFGGENSGHLIFADHATTGDGILSALLVLRMMREKGASLRELASVVEEYPSRLVNLPVRDKPPISTLPKLTALMAEADAAFGPNGRQLIRYSGTEKKIRIMVEHRDAAEVDRWIEKFSAVVKEEIG